MARGNDRPTPPDPHRAAKPPPSRQAGPGSTIPLDAEGRVMRDEALASLRRTGAQRAQLEQRRPTPKGLPVPHRETLHDGAPPPAQRSRTPESGGVEAQRPPRIPNVVIDSVPAPSSKGPSRADWAKLLYRLAGAIVGALVLVIGALGVMWVSRINAKADEAKAKQADQVRAVDARELEWQNWGRAVRAIADCRQRQTNEALQQLLPAADRMGSALKPTPFKDECPAEFPRPP